MVNRKKLLTLFIVFGFCTVASAMEHNKCGSGLWMSLAEFSAGGEIVPKKHFEQQGEELRLLKEKNALLTGFAQVVFSAFSKEDTTEFPEKNEDLKGLLEQKQRFFDLFTKGKLKSSEPQNSDVANVLMKLSSVLDEGFKVTTAVTNDFISKMSVAHRQNMERLKEEADKGFQSIERETTELAFQMKEKLQNLEKEVATYKGAHDFLFQKTGKEDLEQMKEAFGKRYFDMNTACDE